MMHVYMLVQLLMSEITWNGSGYFPTMSTVVTVYPLVCMVLLVHTFTIPWIVVLTLHQLRLVATNMTTNEMINLNRYDHFWVMSGHGRRLQNPFDKGGVPRNCLDFWWYRNRSYRPPRA